MVMLYTNLNIEKYGLIKDHITGGYICNNKYVEIMEYLIENEYENMNLEVFDRDNFVTIEYEYVKKLGLIKRIIKEHFEGTEKTTYINRNMKIVNMVEYTKQIWNITIPGKGDKAFGKHSAIMPEEIVKRCVKLYSFVDDIILDPFCGSGTTLKIAKELNRNYIGYEIYKTYEYVIKEKLNIKDGDL